MEIHGFIDILYLFVDLLGIEQKRKKRKKGVATIALFVLHLHTYTHTRTTLLTSILVAASHVLLLHLAHTLPLAAQVLLPQSNLVVAARDGKNVAAQRPAHTPDNISKLLITEGLLLPG